jgi:WxcM-like, C-terminal
VHRDDRGTLTLASAADVPFTPGRTYVLHDMPVGARRGSHASLTQRRFLVGIAGSSTVTMTDGNALDRSFQLGAGDTLLVGAGVWLEIEVEDPGTQILVFAEGDYTPADYVKDPSKLAAARCSASQTMAT